MTYLERLIKCMCPVSIFTDGHKMDEDTAVFSSTVFATGCRGITCEQCWNQEIKEG